MTPWSPQQRWYWLTAALCVWAFRALVSPQVPDPPTLPTLFAPPEIVYRTREQLPAFTSGEEKLTKLDTFAAVDDSVPSSAKPRSLRDMGLTPVTKTDQPVTATSSREQRRIGPQRGSSIRLVSQTQLTNDAGAPPARAEAMPDNLEPASTHSDELPASVWLSGQIELIEE